VKVLLFSNDTMPFASLPTSGGGLRCWQIYQGLQSSGIEVVASMPAFTYLTKKYYSEIPEEVRENLWEWHTQDEILARIKPDVVMYSSNWDHYNLSKKPDIPLVIDLHGSRLIETSLWGHPSDTNKKVEVFSKADCFICAGKRQRMYFYGWLTQAGRVPQSEHMIRYIPISLSPEEFLRNPLPPDDSDIPFFVSGGGWFPWQDQSNAIFSICNEVVRRNKGLVKIYGTPHDNNSVSPEEKHIREIFSEVKSLSEQHARIQVPGYVGRDALLDEYRKASVAVELMQYNLERELAFTTRTIEYLWCGLPVIYNDYAEISEHISEYNAGWTIDPSDSDAIRRVLSEIFDDPSLVAQKSLNAQRLVRDRFSWDKTITPLVDFINKPQRLAESSPVKGFVARRSPYCAPSGVPVALPLHGEEEIVQEFIYPAEGIWAIEVPYKKRELTGGDNSCQGEVQLRIYSSKGIRTGKISYKLSEVSESGAFLAPISRIFRPLGGSRGRVCISFRGVNSFKNSAITLSGFQEPVYPLEESSSVKKLDGVNALGDGACARVLQLRFHQGGERLYHLRTMMERAYWLIRRGEGRRVIRAILRKFPVLRMSYKSIFSKGIQ
jgi:glycosyltransferase involved in cell wall biosynthesis